MNFMTAMEQTFPFYEHALRDGLKSWLKPDSGQEPGDPRVPAKAILPAMGLGALAALSLYRKLRVDSVDALIAHDTVPADDPLRDHNIATKHPDFSKVNHRTVSVLMAIRASLGSPAAVQRIAKILGVSHGGHALISRPPSAGQLYEAALNHMFADTDPHEGLSVADRNLIDARAARLAARIAPVIETIQEIRNPISN